MQYPARALDCSWPSIRPKLDDPYFHLACAGYGTPSHSAYRRQKKLYGDKREDRAHSHVYREIDHGIIFLYTMPSSGDIESGLVPVGRIDARTGHNWTIGQ